MIYTFKRDIVAYQGAVILLGLQWPIEKDTFCFHHGEPGLVSMSSLRDIDILRNQRTVHINNKKINHYNRVRLFILFDLNHAQRSTD